MADNLTIGLGTKIAVSSTLPATNDLAGYKAAGMVYTVVGEVAEIPSFGAEHETVTFTALADGVTRKYHGSVNYGSMTLPMALDADDAGQIKLKTALSSKARVAFKITYADGSIDYFQGKVFSFRRSTALGEVNRAEANIEIETKIVEDTTP